MKILVTGATGFVGQRLAERLAQKGAEVFCLVRKTSDVERLKAIGVHLVYGDITSKSSLANAVSAMDYIYHLAIASRPKTAADYYLVNSTGTQNLIEACAQYNPDIKKFVYISSLSAAGYSLGKIPLDESVAAHPVSHYGKSKLKAEGIVLSYKDRVPVLILRPPTIYGCGNKLFEYIARIIKAGITLSWEGYTSLLHIDDFLQGAITAAETQEAESKLYFICDENIYSWNQIIEDIERRLGIKRPRVCLPCSFFSSASKFISPFAIALKKPYLTGKLSELSFPYWVCSAKKMQDELHFKAQRLWKES